MNRLHEMPFGARRNDAGGATFRLWAPDARTVELALPGRSRFEPMRALDGGWYQTELRDAPVGLRYAFRIDGDLVVPDPASRSNPEGVHAPSALTEPQAFDWPADGWRGRPWHEAVIYELHVGAFTREGTFAAAIGRLDDLVALGVSAIELMPVAAFPGQRGWGYDGVLLFAPQASYGTPDDLKRLVAAAHARGLMVFMDVVYNHFGPDGNYLHVYAKRFYNDAVRTPWGPSINFDSGADSRTVRDFFIHNALYWIEEFRMDGLRIDAVHAMHDHSVPHFIDELTQALRRGPGRQRHVHVVLENGINDATRLPRDEAGEPLLANAQWNDDVHHALHVITTGEIDGYYFDYQEDPLRLLGRALAEGFGYQGETSRYDGIARGTPSAHLPPVAFVNSVQTHDQVGNRAFGDRIDQLASSADSSAALRALTTCVLLAPSIPMLFMGEEYAASTPFLYFCDFHGELGAAVTKGRREEFGRFERFADPDVLHHIPDPNIAPTFEASKLDWSERTRPPHAAWLALYTELLRLRREHLVPRLKNIRSGSFTKSDAGTLRVSWPLQGGGHWHLLAQLSNESGPPGLAASLPGELVYRSHGGADADALPGWSVLVTLQPS